jgi:hypothetical protein
MDKRAALAVLSQVRNEKQAGLGIDPAEAFRNAAQEPLKREALKSIAQMMLASGGAGAAVAGGVGLFNLMRRNVSHPKRTSHLAEMEMPLPAEKEGGVADEFMRGNFATDKENLPWYLPAMVGGTLGAGALGYQAVSALLRQQRKAAAKAQVAKARQDFQQALLSEHDRPLKLAADRDPGLEKLSADLDRLFDRFEKLAYLAGVIPTNLDELGHAVGAYGGAYGVPAALLAGYATFKATDKGSQRRIMDKALKLRMRRRQALVPPEIVARPVPTNKPLEYSAADDVNTDGDD